MFIHGSTGEDTKENGLKIIWKAWEFIFGMTAECIKVNTKMIRSMAMAYTPGQTAVVTRATGSEESSMVWDPTLCQKTKK